MAPDLPQLPFPEQQQSMPGSSKAMDPQPPVYVMLAADEASYVSGATIAVTGGKPII